MELINNIPNLPQWLIIVVLIISVLSVWIPRFILIIKESITLNSRLEKERKKLELQKLKYEIQFLKKELKIEEEVEPLELYRESTLVDRNSEQQSPDTLEEGLQKEYLRLLYCVIGAFIFQIFLDTSLYYVIGSWDLPFIFVSILISIVGGVIAYLLLVLHRSVLFPNAKITKFQYIAAGFISSLVGTPVIFGLSG